MHIAAIFTGFLVTSPAASAWLAAQWQTFSGTAGSALVTSIWQGAVIVCVLEIATRLMPRISAAHRFALWSAGFVLSLALPLFSLIHFGTGSIASGASSSAVITASPHALLQLDDRWGFVIEALWMLASLSRMASLAVHSVRLRRLWKAAQPVEIGEELADSLKGIRAVPVTVCTTQLLDRPSVIGFLAPRILVPDWLLPRLTSGELQQIVLHEAEHLRRGDDWTNLLQKLCLVAFPLNPVLVWIERHLCREREMACDEGVVSITNAPRAYAACLASLAERRLERRREALSLGAWHHRSELVQRVHRILIHKRTMNKTAAGAVLAALGSLLVAGSVEMSRFPQLVAFVPRHDVEAMTPARQTQLDTVLARDSDRTKLTLPTGYRAVPAKAVLPAAEPGAVARVRKHGSSGSSTDRLNGRSAPSAQQIANVEKSGDRVISSQPPIPQQWVVVAAWEEFSTVSRVPQTVSDFVEESQTARELGPANSARNSPVTANSTSAQTITNQNHSGAAAHRSTVTQLILHVVPASPNSNSPQPAIVPVRDGWFVIQL